MVNLKSLLFGGTANLRHVRRYSGFPIIFPESVAEHSFYVAWYTLIIGESIREDLYDTFDVAKAVRGALIHDLEECVTGDFPRLFKHSSPKILASLQAAAGIAMQKVADEIFTNPTDSLWLQSCWARAKDGQEGALVAFADFLSVLGYLLHALHRETAAVRIHRFQLFKYAQDFNDPKYDFIRPMVTEVQAMLNTALGGTQCK